MGQYLITAEQYLALGREEAWEFLSNPANLLKITPPEMEFQILEGGGEKMFPGQVIHYKVSPFKGIRTRWVSEITHLEEGRYFVDEQRSGPYAMWHHQHHIIPVEGGVCMKDIVNYRLPFGLLGSLMHSLTVKAQLTGIFRYRESELKRRFGALEGFPDRLEFKTL